MNNKRGQAATEYLIILAVVIIIALIVVVILGSFTDVGRGTSAKASAAYWASAPIGIQSYDLSDTVSKNSLIIVNNFPNDINVSSISFDGSTDNIQDVKLTAGGESAVALTSYSCTAGETYSLTVIFTYNNEETGETDLKFQGAVELVGECLDV